MSYPSAIPVSVQQTVTAITLSPIDQSIPLSTSDTPSTEQFTATAFDQFNNAMPMPSGLGWMIPKT